MTSISIMVKIDDLIEGKQYRWTFDSSDKMEEIIKRVYEENERELKKKEIDEEELTLFFEKTYLLKDLTFFDARAKNGSIFEVKMIPRATRYNHNRKLQFIPFSESAPDWRVMNYGMNLEYKCIENGCEWKNNLQIIPLKFGVYDLGDIYCDTKCPKCDKKINPANLVRIGFKNCKYRYEYLRVREKKIKRFKSEWISVKDFCWFDGTKDFGENFIKLKFFVEEVKED